MTSMSMQAYRRLSLTKHPDKSKESNATEEFRIITKAYEVLDGNESKINFDYYLDHPRVSNNIYAFTTVKVPHPVFSATLGLLQGFRSSLLSSATEGRCLGYSPCGHVITVRIFLCHSIPKMGKSCEISQECYRK